MSNAHESTTPTMFQHARVCFKIIHTRTVPPPPPPRISFIKITIIKPESCINICKSHQFALRCRCGCCIYLLSTMELKRSTTLQGLALVHFSDCYPYPRLVGAADSQGVLQGVTGGVTVWPHLVGAADAQGGALVHCHDLHVQHRPAAVQGLALPA